MELHESGVGLDKPSLYYMSRNVVCDAIIEAYAMGTTFKPFLSGGTAPFGRITK